MRIVSLLPSATEIVYALGLEPVGVSQECDYPPEAQSKPVIVRSTVDGDAASKTINEQVTAAEQSGGVYEIDRDALERVNPDLLISQGMCDVCAIDTTIVTDAVSDLGLHCNVVNIDPHSLDDVFRDIRRIGEETDTREQAQNVVSTLKQRVDKIERTVGEKESQPRVAVFDWMNPVMVAGHWMPELVELAGGEYGMADPRARARPREWTEILEYDPEVIVVAPCGFTIDQTEAHLHELTTRPGWTDLTAVGNDEIYLLDGHNYANRPGPRLVETVEYLAGILQPTIDSPPENAVRRISRPKKKS